MGESQLTLNYVRALSDYITNFCFNKGVQFQVPEQHGAIIPHVLHKVWEEDNDKPTLLWEMGQLASVTGDCFVKVAYDEPWQDPLGIVQPGKVRILPVNPAWAFPEYHPHDKNRIIRFKMKYRYWGTAPEGTRQVFTFTEILTDDTIEQYINDELIDQYPNPIGKIPIVHIKNVSVSSSPWGQSDIWDIINLNREMNEKLTEVSDIINYHSAPVTIITGAKMSQLERGAKKVWAGLPEKASVFNLESSGEMGGAMEYVAFIKRVMHEITGVPENALGQSQAISNTSGVALAIQYQPMMNRYSMKRTHFSKGLIEVNELVLRTIAVHEPERFSWTQGVASPPESDQVTQIDPFDPLTYQTTCHWPEPLPVDVLIKLNELQMKMLMGLESKKGAMRALGEEFPTEKLQEVYEELREDALDQGALTMINAKIHSAVAAMTGLLPADSGEEVAQSTGEDGGEGSPSGNSGGATMMPEPDGDLVNSLVSRAYGAHLAQRRTIDFDATTAKP